MSNLKSYKDRFYKLLESQMGNVKPLITEQKSDFVIDRQSNDISRAFGGRSEEDYNTVNDFSFGNIGKDSKVPYAPESDSVFQSYGKNMFVWQEMLRLLGQKLGNSGPKGNGVDGDFGIKSKTALKNLTGNYKTDLTNFRKLYNSIERGGKIGELNTFLSSIAKVKKDTKVTKDKVKTDTKVTKDKVKTDVDTKSAESGFVIPFAFPEYEPKVDGTGDWAKFLGKVVRTVAGGKKEGTYGKLGHAGVSVVDSNGKIYTYEFGRYKSAEMGCTIKSNPTVIAKFDSQGNISNLEQVLKGIRLRTQGDGPREKMSYAVLKAPNPKDAISYGNQQAAIKEREYSALDFSITNEAANCGTFTSEVVKAAGVSIPESCFPVPVAMIASMSLISNVQGLPSGEIA